MSGNMHKQSKGIIVGFVADLMFTTRIEQVANHLGYEMRWLGEAAALGQPSTLNQPGEQLEGQEGQMTSQVVQWQPVLLLFDLSNEAIPWQKWIALLKSSPATRRFPILAYGAHVDVETMQTARERGADGVVARSRLASALPDLIEKYARSTDFSQQVDACAEPLSALAIKGLELFNEGDYFECHEYLEDAWNEDQGPGRELYRAILQVAVAYLQIERGNYRGAVKMFMRARQWFEPYPAVCRGINIAQLQADAQVIEDALQALGPHQVGELDRSLFKLIEYSVS